MYKLVPGIPIVLFYHTPSPPFVKDTYQTQSASEDVYEEQK